MAWLGGADLSYVSIVGCCLDRGVDDDDEGMLIADKRVAFFAVL